MSVDTLSLRANFKMGLTYNNGFFAELETSLSMGVYHFSNNKLKERNHDNLLKSKFINFKKGNAKAKVRNIINNNTSDKIGKLLHSRDCVTS